MEIISHKEFEIRKEELIQKIRDGAIFIYPTDTIYGIGCDAKNEASVKKIRELKQRPESPFSVIAPSIEWIKENCVVDEKWVDKLPGPYTLIFKLKNKDCVAQSVLCGKEGVGVRIPDHWISKLVEEAGIPVVTTSVNIAGKPSMTKAEDLDPTIEQGVDFCLYEGELQGKGSTVVDVENDTILRE